MSRRSCSRSATPGRRASCQRAAGSAVAAPAERRTRRSPGRPPTHVSAGAPIASAASCGPSPCRSSAPWKSAATCSASAVVVAAARRARAASSRSTSRGPSSTASPVEDSAARSSPDSRVQVSRPTRARADAPRAPAPARAATRQQRAAAGARKPERLGAPARVGLLHAPVGEVGQERAARARAQLLVVLLAQQVDRHRQRRALHRHAVEVVERVLERERQQPPPRGVQQPHVDGEHALGGLAARLGAVQVRPRRQRQVVAGRPGRRSRRASRRRPRARTGLPTAAPARRGSRARRGPAGSAR